MYSILIITVLDKDHLYFVTYATVGWIDLFPRNEYKSIVKDSLQHCIQQKGLDVYVWCMMTNHVHLIVHSRDKPLENILGADKRHTSEMLQMAVQRDVAESRRKRIVELCSKAGKGNSNNSNFQLWRQHNRPIELWSRDVIMQKLNYIHNNKLTLIEL